MGWKPNVSSTPTGVEWTPYTPTITSTSGTVTLASSSTLKGIYKVIGKTLYVHFYYHHVSGTGASGASGYYLFSLPNGYQINTSLTDIYNATDPYVALPFGTGSARCDNATALVEAIAYDTSKVMLRSLHSWNVIGIGANNFLISTNNIGYSFHAEIPIL